MVHEQRGRGLFEGGYRASPLRRALERDIVPKIVDQMDRADVARRDLQGAVQAAGAAGRGAAGIAALTAGGGVLGVTPPSPQGLPPGAVPGLDLGPEPDYSRGEAGPGGGPGGFSWLAGLMNRARLSTEQAIGAAGTPPGGGMMDEILDPETRERLSIGPALAPLSPSPFGLEPGQEAGIAPGTRQGILPVTHGQDITPEEAQSDVFNIQANAEDRRIRSEATKGLEEALGVTHGATPEAEDEILWLEGKGGRASFTTQEGEEHVFNRWAIEAGDVGRAVESIGRRNILREPIPKNFVEATRAGWIESGNLTRHGMPILIPPGKAGQAIMEIVGLLGELHPNMSIESRYQEATTGILGKRPTGKISIPGGRGFGDEPTDVPVDYFLQKAKIQRAQIKANKTGKSVRIPGKGLHDTYVHPKKGIPRRGEQLKIPGAFEPPKAITQAKDRTLTDPLRRVLGLDKERDIKAKAERWQKDYDRDLSRVLKGETTEARKAVWENIQDEKIKKILKDFLPIADKGLPVRTIMSDMLRIISLGEKWISGYKAYIMREGSTPEEYISLRDAHPYSGLFPGLSIDNLNTLTVDQIRDAIVKRYLDIAKSISESQNKSGIK